MNGGSPTRAALLDVGEDRIRQSDDDTFAANLALRPVAKDAIFQCRRTHSPNRHHVEGEMKPRLLTRRLFKTKRAQSFKIHRAVGERAVNARPLPREGFGQ